MYIYNVYIHIHMYTYILYIRILNYSITHQLHCWYLSQRTGHVLCSHKNLYTKVESNSTHNSHKLKQPKRFTMALWTLVHSYCEILLSNTRGTKYWCMQHLDGSLGTYAALKKKSQSQKVISCKIPFLQQSQNYRLERTC